MLKHKLIALVVSAHVGHHAPVTARHTVRTTEARLVTEHLERRVEERKFTVRHSLRDEARAEMAAWRRSNGKVGQ